jgi:hypothetical protein
VALRNTFLMMTDSDFLRHLQATDKIEYGLFGCSPYWKIKNTGLCLHEKQRLVHEPNYCSSESQWLLGTYRYNIILKQTNFGDPLEEFWNGLDFAALEEEGSDTPDF